jgi:ElaB/YqjD/DUF883 family membrane-anchored ribosome-binding protein
MNDMTTTQNNDLSEIKWPYAESVIKERAEKYNRLIISDNRSYNATKAARTEFVSIRTSIDKALKEGNKPLNDMIKRNRDEAKRLIELAKPTEDYLQEQVRAWEEKKEAERQAKIAAEKARVAAIQAKISEITKSAANVNGVSSDLFYARIATIESITIDASYEEFQQQATEAKEDALILLREQLAVALETEAKLEAERIERERQDAERKAEAERLAAEAERLRIEREKLEDEKREIEGQKGNKHSVSLPVAQTIIDKAPEAVLTIKQEQEGPAYPGYQSLVDDIAIARGIDADTAINWIVCAAEEITSSKEEV